MLKKDKMVHTTPDVATIELQKFYFPSLGKTVMANSLEEAIELSANTEEVKVEEPTSSSNV